MIGSPADPRRSDYGSRIYYGVLPPGGATGEAAGGTKRELMKAPASGDELPHSRFTRRKKELLDFPAEDSGKTGQDLAELANAEKTEPYKRIADFAKAYFDREYELPD